MADFVAFAIGMHALALPVFGVVVLLASKLSTRNKQFAQAFFMASLTLVTLVTLRTVSQNDSAWLAHMLTLAVMILGAVWLPAMDEHKPVGEPA